LKLTPAQFDELSPIDLYEMLEAYRSAEKSRRMETAYWVSYMINVHLKKPVKIEKLMKPFMPKKTAGEVEEEREEFFRKFNQKGGK